MSQGVEKIKQQNYIDIDLMLTKTLMLQHREHVDMALDLNHLITWYK